MTAPGRGTRFRSPHVGLWTEAQRKPAVTGARYKYFIPGEIGSQINSTRGHISGEVVKKFLTVQKATVNPEPVGLKLER